MLLGSVGHHRAAHARCPVVIVHQVPARKQEAAAHWTHGACLPLGLSEPLMGGLASWRGEVAPLEGDYRRNGCQDRQSE